MNARFYNAEITENKAVCDNIYLMTALLPIGEDAPHAGQFYMLRTWAQTEPPLLSRPISVHFYNEATREISFLYEKRGTGTEKLSAAKKGEFVALTGPSGNGFNLDVLNGKIALVGGGIGTAPLLLLAERLHNKGCEVTCLLGFRDTPYRIDEFEKYARVKLATDTGAVGHKGFVTDLLSPDFYSAVCVCGPEIMMKKTARLCMNEGIKVYVSREGKMACGVGACLGCTCKTKNGGKSVCKDGPVFEGSDVYFED